MLRSPPDPDPQRLAPATNDARSGGARRCRRKFLRFFPGGFRDETYVAWEREYKWTAHEKWEAQLGKPKFARLIRQRAFREIAALAVRIEGRTNLLFSFEKMALRDAVVSGSGAQAFAVGLYRLLHGRGDRARRFDAWCDVLSKLARRQRRVLTWPVATVFPFLAEPQRHVFLKPRVTRAAAAAYGFEFDYLPQPAWEPTYSSLLRFAARVRRDLRDLEPRDLIDIQSFLWVQGSDEY